KADGHGAGYARNRPAGVPSDRLQQHRQRKHAADGDTAKQAAGGDDHPAIAGISHLQSPIRPSLAARRTRIAGTDRPLGVLITFFRGDWRRRNQAFAPERRIHSSRPTRPRRASPNGTSECSSTRPPKYRASGSLTTSRRSPTAFR